MADLETIKLLIRSLLISSPHPLTIEELRRDYKKNENQDCPFVALGYKNWLSFLQSLPDTLQVLSNGTCRAVSTKETQHIQNMVALQKKAKRRPCRAAPPPRYNSYRSISYSNFNSSSGSQSSRYSHNSYQRPLRENTSKTEDMEQFFRDAQEAKRKLNEERKISNTMGARTSSAQRTESPVRNNCNIRPGDRHDGYDSDSSIDSFCDRFEYVRPQTEKTSEGNKSLSYPSTCKEKASNFVCDNNTNYETNTAKKTNVIEANSNEEFLDSPFSKSSSKVSDGLKRNLRLILSDSPDGVWACVLPELYQEKFGYSLNWSELGYNSVCQMAHDLPDVFVCKRIKSGDWRLFDARQPLPVAYSEESSSSGVPNVPESVFKRMKSLAKLFPSGIKGMEFAQLYREHYSRTLLSEVPGCKDVETLLKSVRDSAVHLRYVLKECYVYPVMNEAEPDESPLSAFDQKMAEELGLYPEEVLGPEDHYPAAELPFDLKEGSYFELLVAEVYNPHKFWIQLRKMNTKLDQLMDDLNEFYLLHGNKYKMPPSTIYPGLCCAATYCDEWHRACIATVLETEAEVFYVDFGTLVKKPKEELRFLHKDFSTLPKLAIHASLFGIQPPKGSKRFSAEANKLFLELVSGKPLVGLAHKVDLDVPSLELFLIDTSGTTDVHLNDVLVNKKHADFITELLDAEESVGDTSVRAPAEVENVVEVPQPKHTSPQKPQAPSASELISQSEPSQAFIGSRSYLPPPGFHSSNVYNQAGSQAGNMGTYSSGLASTPCNMPGVVPPLANFNPLAANMNPALAAYSQVVAMQQQAMMMAMYQNILQQNMNASLLNSQHKSSNVMGNPWLGSPLLYPQSQPLVPGSRTVHAPQSTVIDPHVTVTGRSPETLKSKPNTDSVCNTTKTNIENSNNSVMHPQYISERECAKSEEKITKKNRENASTIVSAISKPQDENYSPSRKNSQRGKDFPQGMADSIALEEPLNEFTSQNNCKVNISITKPVIKSNALNVNNLQSSENVNNDTVDCWEELADKTVDEDNGSSSSSVILESSSSSTSEVQRITHKLADTHLPDPVDSPTLRTPLNFWKEIYQNGKKMHLFNLESKGFVSTEELAKQFTPFSNSSSVMRVLEAKGIAIPFLKLSRQQNLPLFSAFDGCIDSMVSGLGLMRNKSGNVVGNVHLTPISHIPSMLMVLGICEDIIIEGFQALRDEFSHDPFWK